MKLIFEVLPGKKGERWAVLLFNVKEKDVYIQFLPLKYWTIGHNQMWFDGPINIYSFIFFEFVTMYP